MSVQANQDPTHTIDQPPTGIAPVVPIIPTPVSPPYSVPGDMPRRPDAGVQHVNPDGMDGSNRPDPAYEAELRRYEGIIARELAAHIVNLFVLGTCEEMRSQYGSENRYVVAGTSFREGIYSRYAVRIEIDVAAIGE